MLRADQEEIMTIRVLVAAAATLILAAAASAAPVTYVLQTPGVV